MINNQLIISQKYARAFLNVFTLANSDIKKLADAITFLDQHPKIGIFLKIPLLDSQVKYNALKESIIERFELPASFGVLVQVLIHKKRSELLLPVLEQIKKQYQKQHHITPFSISSSSQLPDVQKEILEKYLADVTGDTIDAQYTIDKKLIAGVRMQSDELQWEDSIAHRLKKIRKETLLWK